MTRAFTFSGQRAAAMSAVTPPMECPTRTAGASLQTGWCHSGLSHLEPNRASCLSGSDGLYVSPFPAAWVIVTLFQDPQLHAAILGPALLGFVRGHGIGLAIADGPHARGHDAFRNQVIKDNLASSVGEPFVIDLRACPVGVPCQFHPDLGVLLQSFRRLIEGRFCLPR